MSAILGSLLGFASSFLPPILDQFKKREEYKQQSEQHRMTMDEMELVHRQKMEVLKLQNEFDLSKSVQTIKELDLQGDLEQTKQIYQHDTQLSVKNENPIVAALSASVRPVVTYVFFMLFLLVKVVGLYVAYKSDLPIDQMVQILWNDETNAIFAAIISFWFGQRAMQKFSKK